MYVQYRYLVLAALVVFFNSNRKLKSSILPSHVINTTLYRGEADRTLEALLKALVFLVKVVVKHFRWRISDARQWTGGNERHSAEEEFSTAIWQGSRICLSLSRHDATNSNASGRISDYLHPFWPPQLFIVFLLMTIHYYLAIRRAVYFAGNVRPRTARQRQAGFNTTGCGGLSLDSHPPTWSI